MTLEKFAQDLLEQCDPVEIKLENQSQRHKGHQGFVDGTISHVAVDITAEQFNQQSLIQRHKQIYTISDKAFSTPLHALAIMAKETQQVETKNG